MASGRYKGRGSVCGQPKGKDANWLADVLDERRFNFAWDIANEATHRTVTCSKCGDTADCYNAAVTVGYGAVAFMRCRGCGRKFTRSVSPEKMDEYYLEAVQEKIAARSKT